MCVTLGVTLCVTWQCGTPLAPLGRRVGACARVLTPWRRGERGPRQPPPRVLYRVHLGVGQREEQQASGAEEVSSDEHDRRDVERRWEAELRVP